MAHVEDCSEINLSRGRTYLIKCRPIESDLVFRGGQKLLKPLDRAKIGLNRDRLIQFDSTQVVIGSKY